jgi:hypothetical protein
MADFLRDSFDLDEPLLAGSKVKRHPLRLKTIFSHTYLRKVRRRAIPIVKYGFVLATILFFSFPLFFSSYVHEPASYTAFRALCQDLTSGCANPANEKVFIAVSLYDATGSLASGEWGDSVVQLVHILGPENVFLSIYENDSGEAGRTALESLSKRLSCGKSFVADDHVSFDGIPQVTLPGNFQRTKRVAFLAEVRNRSLRPLDKFVGDKIVEFDKILFLNDIFFHPIEAALLLFNTNASPDGKADYLAACSMDYRTALDYYDIFALRDVEGYATSQVLFPIVRNQGRGLSRMDIIAQKDAVRVKSCWGGMAAVQAKYIQNLNQSLPDPNFQQIGRHVVDPSRPPAEKSLIRFRHEPEAFYDACECCLLMADLAEAAKLDGGRNQEIFMNPYVRVAYTKSVFRWLSVARYWERFFLPFYDLKDYFNPKPVESPHREVNPGEKFLEEVWDNEQARWRLVERTGRSGLFCGVSEMFLMRSKDRVTDEDGGRWAKAYLPPGRTLDFATYYDNILPLNWKETFTISSPEEQRVFFDFK